MIEKTVFSSQDLPPELDDRARFNRWVDVISPIGPADYEVAREVPFVASNSLYRVGEILVGSASGSILGVKRTKYHVSANVAPCYYLFVNSGAGLVHGVQGGKEVTLRSGEAALLSDFDPIQMRGGPSNRWYTVFVPQNVLESRFDKVRNGTSIVVRDNSEALGLLKQFSKFLVGTELNSPMMVEHAANTLGDLVGLASGLAPRELELSPSNGLRAARLLAIEQKIASQFDDPHVSGQRVAMQLGLSARYIYDLLQQTGTSFGDRILELRLRKTQVMLADPNYAHMRISEVAFLCGFSDISYFNRCFRRRFGCTPTAAR